MRRATHRIAILAVAALVAACGAGDGTTTSETTPGAVASPTRAPGGGPGATATVRIRLINLYQPPGQPPPTVGLYLGRQPKPGDAPLVEARFAQVSDYVNAPAKEALTVYPTGRLDPENRFEVSPFGGFDAGDRITIVVHGVRSRAFFRALEAGNPGNGAEWPAAPAGKALVLIYAGALQGAVPSDLQSFFWVVPGSGCLKDVAGGGNLAFGGNIPKYATVDPGRVTIAGSSKGCSAAPVIGPVTIEVKAGDRVAIFPYGTGPNDLQLLAVPMPER